MSASDNTKNDTSSEVWSVSEKKVISDELTHIQKQFPQADENNLCGLAFSGGGIRSSTFSLGVMQALAEKGLLKKFHYLSTVSGGGYIGSALTWLMNSKDGNDFLRFNAGDKFPLKNDNQQDDISKRLLRHMRQGSNYLTPGGGISMASLLAVILRGSLLSLLVYIIPLTAIMFLCLSAHLFGSPELLAGYAPSGGNVLINIAKASALVFVVVAVFYGWKTSEVRSSIRGYKGRRAFEEHAGKLLIFTGAVAVVGSLPMAAGLFVQAREIMAASLTLGGAVTSAMAIIKVQGKGEGKIPLGLIAPVAFILLVYGVLLSSYLIALHIYSSSAWFAGVGLFAASALLAWFLGTRVNINYISIHRYYRDRLMELFMPDLDDIMRENRSDMATTANDSSLHEMCMSKNGPYHLINTNMVTEGSSNKRLRGRGGENFLLSPLYCGSKATGWSSTETYMAKKMNLATAMAISGAAADPHGAPGGDGLTRNKSLSFLMALLNIRLGYWAPNPAKESAKVSRSPSWFGFGYKELLGTKMDETDDFVHLADGGHFENLAVYELIRRRVQTIVVCDGGADAGFTFVDFANLVEKIRVDFGVEIEVNGHPNFAADGKQAKSLLAMCPKPNEYHPHGVALAGSGFVTATIKYGNGVKDGTMVYIKTTLIGGLPDDIYSYKRGHDAFPDESTADQFFDEKQFEAYRELGYQIGMTLPDGIIK
ncbi:patatin-like phospholipase [Mariprofundus micogutta]|uniref:Patatin-like phospholipase n=1 Tax=Mariprofundus micogutta TaxID=1921010 RepID=A0A1L8CRB4_9PROT|nr:patatin-like phospholipase family protein [Mariprofundus micogutta]GAV21414.1 patatin-like phospholipase [Mariprofundus micogutta]